MKTLLRIAVLLFLLVIGVAAGGYFYLQSRLRVVQPIASATVVDIPRGLGAREVVRLLQDKGVIYDENAALGYLLLSGTRNKLKAGEYLFENPMTIPAILDKLASGSVYLHRFTVPEGLTLAQTSAKWEEQGFGTAPEFLSAAGESVSLIHDIHSAAETLEGYLFPETYSFPSGTTARQAIEAMVARFRQVLKGLQETVPPAQWPRDLGQTVILASLIEEEAAHSDERSVIASVYLNRLNRNMLLQCDPTVIYALERANLYRGQLTLDNLKFDSPYNTYRYPGLPPTAIANPGYASLHAAVQPGQSNYLYFVRTAGGRHTFSETLAAHNRAVAMYRAQQRRGR